MKLFDAGVLIIVGIVIVALVTGALSIKALGKGNVVEKAEAEVVAAETGVPAAVVEEVEEKAYDAVEGK